MADDDAEIRAQRLHAYRLRVRHQRLSWRLGLSALSLMYVLIIGLLASLNLKTNDSIWEQTADVGSLLFMLFVGWVVVQWLRRMRTERSKLREEMAELDALPVLPSWVPGVVAALIASVTAVGLAVSK